MAFPVPVNVVMHAFRGLPAGAQRQSGLYHFLANVGPTGAALLSLAIPRPRARSLDAGPSAIARLCRRLARRGAIDVAPR